MQVKNLKILAIGDNKDNLETLKAVVLDALPGCSLLTALNEPQGVELARTEDPDVILLEGVLTGMDGYAVCRTLKRDERLRDIPVVFLTAPRTDRDSCVKALEAGAEAFLSQPLDKQELAAQVPAMARLKAANQLRRRENEQLAALVSERTRELEKESAERIRTAEALNASEELFRKLFEDHAAVKLLIDPDTGQIIDANQAAAQFYGWSRDQLKKMKMQDINTLPPKQVNEEMDRARTGKQTNFEFRHRRADGSIRDVDVCSSKIEAKGKALLHSIIIDITERKQAEEVLSQQNGALFKLNCVAGEFLRLSSEDNLEAFIAKQIKEIAGAKVAIFSTYNSANRTISIQHIEMESALLEKVVRLIGKQINQIHSPVSDEMYREMTTEMIGTRRSLYEASFGAISHPVGAAIEALLNVDRFIGIAYLIEGELYGTSLLAMGKGQPDPAKNILENFIALAAVSLRRKRAEEELIKSAQLLRETGELAKVGGWELDLSTEEVFWTEEVYRIHGVEPGHKPRLEEALDFYAPESKSALEKAIRKAMDTGEPYDLESLFIPSGSKDKIWVRSIGKAVYSGGKMVSLLGAFQNIDKSKRAAEALRASQQLIEGIINAIPLRVFWKDKNLVFLGCNAAFARDAGFGDPKDLIGKDDYQMRWRDQAELYRVDDRQVIEDGCSKLFIEEPQTAPEGNVVTLLTSKMPLRNSTGEVSGVLGVYMDITQRKMLEEALRESEEIFSEFMNHCPVYVFFKDENIKAVKLSKNYEEMLGKPISELLGKNMNDLFPLAFAKAMVEDDRRILEEGKQVEVEEELSGRSYSTVKFPIFREGKPTYLAGFSIDITERKQAEAALRESEERFRTFIEDAPVAIGVARDGKTVYGNEAYLRMFGIATRELVVGHPLIELVAPQCRNEVAERAMRRSHGEPAEEDYEMMAMRLDGQQFPCRVAATVVTLSDGPATMGFFFDLTKQKETERKIEDSRGKLRSLALHLLHAREEERTKVAREIHDELGQILTALKMDLQWIEKKLAPRSTQVMDKIYGVIGLADQTIQIVHRISSELRPGMLDDLGLAAAIEWLGVDFSRRNGIPCRVDITVAETRIGGNSSTSLFRIVQEALANVARHAHASRASVEIWEGDRTLMIRVQDDGRGVTVEQSMSPLSLGLIGIRERVQDLGGEMSITGQPGEGTLLEVKIPLPSTGALA